MLAAQAAVHLFVIDWLWPALAHHPQVMASYWRRFLAWGDWFYRRRLLNLEPGVSMHDPWSAEEMMQQCAYDQDYLVIHTPTVLNIKFVFMTLCGGAIGGFIGAVSDGSVRLGDIPGDLWRMVRSLFTDNTLTWFWSVTGLHYHQRAQSSHFLKDFQGTLAPTRLQKPALPVNLFCRCLQFLDRPTLLSASLVNKHWYGAHR